MPGGCAKTFSEQEGTARPGAAGPTGIEPGCLVTVGVVVLGAIAALALLFVLGGGSDDIDVGNVADYEPGSAVYRSTDGFFIVRLADGAVIALSDVDPHNPPGRRSCRVTFRVDLGEEAGAGRFFDSCTGSMYDIAGQGLAGDGLDLQPITVEQSDSGDLTVPRDRSD